MGRPWILRFRLCGERCRSSDGADSLPFSQLQFHPRVRAVGLTIMATVGKKELIDRIADRENLKRGLVKLIVQSFLDEIVEEVGNGNRLEFRDFGVFYSRTRAARVAQNPKTLGKIKVPSKRSVRFRPGQGLKNRLLETPPTVDSATGLIMEPSAHRATKGR